LLLLPPRLLGLGVFTSIPISSGTSGYDTSLRGDFNKQAGAIVSP
jgi:hypothetical protein